MNLVRNKPGQYVTVFAYDEGATPPAPKTGDAANITVYVAKDNGTPTATTNAATEISSTLAPGYYRVALLQGESNADVVETFGKSTTSNITVTGCPPRQRTLPDNHNRQVISPSGHVAIRPQAIDLRPRSGTSYGNRPDATASGGSANLGDGGVAYAYTLMDGIKRRFIQDGICTGCQLLSSATASGYTELRFIVYRLVSGTTFTEVGRSEDFKAQITSTGTLLTITFDQPIKGVQHGDYYGMLIAVPGVGTPLYSHSETGTTYRYTSAVTPTATYDWSAASAASNLVNRVNALMECPGIHTIGSSVMAGHRSATTGHYNYAYDTTPAASDPTSTIWYALGLLSGATVRDASIGANTAEAMALRFSADVCAAKPRICFAMEMWNSMVAISGITSNTATDPDIATAKASFLASWRTMADLSLANGFPLVIMEPHPYQNASTQMLTVAADWVPPLQSFAESYLGTGWMRLKELLSSDDGYKNVRNTSPFLFLSGDDSLHLTATAHAAIGSLGFAQSLQVLSHGDLPGRLPQSLTSAGHMKSDALAISGDTPAADNLERWYDGTVGFGTSGDTISADLAGTITGDIIGNLLGGVQSVSGDISGKVLGSGGGTIVGAGAWALDDAGAAIAPAATALSTAVWTSTIAGRIDENIGSRLAGSAYTAPDNASIAAILDDTGTEGVVVASLSSEAIDSILDEALAELAAVPAAAPSLRAAMQFLYQKVRNRETVTATAATISNDAGTVIATSSLSDDNVTFAKGEYS